MYVCACFILTEINAVARIHPLAVDTEVVFDGKVDGSRVQCVYVLCVSISEERADSTDVSVGLGIHSSSTAPQIV